MTTASAPGGRHGPVPRSARSSSRPGAHAARPRRTWVGPVAAVAAVVLAVTTWQVLSSLLPADGPAAVSTSTGPSVPSASVGANARVSIGDTGRLHVVETVVLAEATEWLDLSVPPRAGAGEPFRPTISNLEVSQPGLVTQPAPLEGGDETRIRLTSAATRIVLEYDASGVVVRSGNPNTPERALALVTPLVVAQASGLPSTVAVQSVKVLNVGCLLGAELTGCGTETPDGWTVETSGGPDDPRPDVLAQVDLAIP